jgi:FAD/FMN-containing dehydrogenase
MASTGARYVCPSSRMQRSTLHGNGRQYPTFLADEGLAGVRSAYGDGWPRLVALKDRYDPTNVFRLNANIPPSALSE